jgi:hypothetical protein
MAQRQQFERDATRLRDLLVLLDDVHAAEDDFADDAKVAEDAELLAITGLNARGTLSSRPRRISGARIEFAASCQRRPPTA